MKWFWTLVVLIIIALILWYLLRGRAGTDVAAPTRSFDDIARPETDVRSGDGGSTGTGATGVAGATAAGAAGAAATFAGSSSAAEDTDWDAAADSDTDWDPDAAADTPVESGTDWDPTRRVTSTPVRTPAARRPGDKSR